MDIFFRMAVKPHPCPQPLYFKGRTPQGHKAAPLGSPLLSMEGGGHKASQRLNRMCTHSTAVSPGFREAVISQFQLGETERVPDVPKGAGGVKQITIGGEVSAQTVMNLHTGKPFGSCPTNEYYLCIYEF